MIPVEPEGGTLPPDAYRLVGSQQTFRVNADGTTTPIVLITATSQLYGTTFFWFITEKTFQSGGAPAATGAKTQEVNAVAGHPHVQGFRSEQDQDVSGLLYNYAVITVGTDDLAITATVKVRMDHLGAGSTFDAIDAAWQRLVDLGAS